MIDGKKTQNDWTREFCAKAYDEIKLRIIKGNRDALSTYCAEHDTSVNNYINSLIQADLAKQGIDFPIPAKRVRGLPRTPSGRSITRPT